MIVFGAAISSRETYDRVAAPSIRRVVEPDSLVLTREGHDSIQRPYNEMMDEAAAIPELEALVLLHQDLELTDDSLLPRVRPLLRDPRTGVVGVHGARRDGHPQCWLDAKHRFGTSVGPDVDICHSMGSYEVDVVDGVLLAIAPWVVRSVRFDERLAADFHGYDVDFSMRVRAAGGRVICDDVPYFHHMERPWRDRAETIRGCVRVAKMWEPALRPIEWAPSFPLQTDSPPVPHPRQDMIDA